MSNERVPAAACTSMGDVRAAIDVIDRELVTLLRTRLDYIEAAARIKTVRDQVRDDWRINDVLNKVAETAKNASLPEDMARTVFAQLIELSIAHELTVFDRLKPGSAT